jgi:hypothetical protein
MDSVGNIGAGLLRSLWTAATILMGRACPIRHSGGSLDVRMISHGSDIPAGRSMTRIAGPRVSVTWALDGPSLSVLKRRHRFLPCRSGMFGVSATR